MALYALKSEASARILYYQQVAAFNRNAHEITRTVEEEMLPNMLAKDAT